MPEAVGGGPDLRGAAVDQIFQMLDISFRKIGLSVIVAGDAKPDDRRYNLGAGGFRASAIAVYLQPGRALKEREKILFGFAVTY